MGLFSSAINAGKFIFGVAKLAKDGGDYNTGIDPKDAKKTTGTTPATPSATTAPAENKPPPAKGWSPK